MIRINLLPHREQKRKAQQIRFYVVAGASAALGVFIVVAGYSLLEQRISTQDGRNTFLQAEIDNLDKQISEIEVLRTKRKDLLDRKQVVERLQANRGEVVVMLDQLTRQTPEGVYLRLIEPCDAKKPESTCKGSDMFRLVGHSLSNARISTFMRSLNDSPAFEMPALVEIKAVKEGGQRLNEFVMNVKLTRAEDKDAKAGVAGKTETKK